MSPFLNYFESEIWQNQILTFSRQLSMVIGELSLRCQLRSSHGASSIKSHPCVTPKDLGSLPLSIAMYDVGGYIVASVALIALLT